MNNFTFSKRSLTNMRGCHPHGIAVTARALQISSIDFVVTEGLRSQERQQYLFDTGKSKTLNSAHRTGYAQDCYPILNGDVEVNKIAPFVEMAKAFKQASVELGVSMRWGGDWDRDGDWKDERFFDGCHFELDRPAYDWDDLHPTTKRSEWGDDMAALLHLDESALSPIGFPLIPTQELEGATIMSRLRRLGR